MQGPSAPARVNHAGPMGARTSGPPTCCLPLSEWRRHPEFYFFRGSMAGLCTPLSTLRHNPHGFRRTTRGQCGSLLLHRDGLSPSSPCRSPGALRRSATFYSSPHHDGTARPTNRYLNHPRPLAGQSLIQPQVNRGRSRVTALTVLTPAAPAPASRRASTAGESSCGSRPASWRAGFWLVHENYTEVVVGHLTGCTQSKV
jgi:hypothetical protein